MSEDPGNADHQSNQLNVQFPRGVKAAGVIWILFGLASLTPALALGIAAALGGAARSGSRFVVGSAGCSILLTLTFLVVGIQTIRGSVKGTRTIGIASTLFALLCAGLTVFNFVSMRQDRYTRGLAAPCSAVTMLFVVAPLLIGGLMAISNRKAYAAWRAARGLHQSPEEEDYDDRPRQPSNESES
ncbi:MAG TPA: hypothetical protein VHR66_12935 [Gemmataceae bacterium]|jgi:hypothetical protein|nr:hypothetical protein [Gemmataceae bacterium]